MKSGGGFSEFSHFLKSGGGFGVDFQIPHFSASISVFIVQIGPLGARIRPFYDPGRFFFGFVEIHWKDFLNFLMF